MTARLRRLRANASTIHQLEIFATCRYGSAWLWQFDDDRTLLLWKWRDCVLSFCASILRLEAAKLRL